MILFNSSAESSEPGLVCVEATLTTPGKVYTISSNGPVTDDSTIYRGGLFGAMSWPTSRFQIAPGVVLEQQMFLPHDGSAAAVSWQLRGESLIAARLTVKPFFQGCGPRSYRDSGFRADEETGRLSWLPNVRGPQILADTNGHYHDEPTLDRSGEFGPSDLFAPGAFEFQLSRAPSVLILIKATTVNHQFGQHIGAFLAGLLPGNERQHRDSQRVADLIKAA